MPERNYNYTPQRDLYTQMYEQYYFKQTQPTRVTPIKPAIKRRKVVVKQKKKSNFFINLIRLSIITSLLCFVLPYSFNNFILNMFPENSKKALNVDYNKLLYPTNSYLYNKDLFLGKYIIKDTEYGKKLMINIPENQEMKSLERKLLNIADKYKKIKPSIYVWDYSTKNYVDINANVTYPAASIIKLPILIEMFREIDNGKFALNDTMILEDYYRASGSGKLQYSQGGRALTMDYLARIMIENSDNSSTNMIIAKMGGMPDINREIKKWGLKTTHLNNWLPDLEGTNITTSKEIAQMLYNIDKTNMVSEESKKHIADYLSHVKNNRLLQAGLPSNAILLHKTGDIGYMLGDAGIVKTPSGKKYIVSILAKRPYNNQQGKKFIVEASKTIYNHLAY